jgi:hypothetical protein
VAEGAACNCSRAQRWTQVTEDREGQEESRLDESAWSKGSIVD